MTTTITRRTLITSAAAAAALLILQRNSTNAQTQGDIIMSTFATTDGTNIFYKDWGPRDAQPIVFHHGWPLSSDDWDNQMLTFLEEGYRVIAHDRRGHGRSDQTEHGNDMDTYAQDVVELVRTLDLKNAIHIGHSTGGGEATRYAAVAEPGRIAKVVLIGAVTPVMAQTASNPEGVPLEVFDGFRSALIANRAQFFLDIPSGPFFGFNREGATVSLGQIQNWWRQGMMGSVKAHYDCVKAFSETDFTEDLKGLSIPVLILHGEDDQIVPIDNTARKAVKLLKNGTLKTYPGLSHAPFATHPELVNADLLAFARS
jgi:non-heme chloroperoxidase